MKLEEVICTGCVLIDIILKVLLGDNERKENIAGLEIHSTFNEMEKQEIILRFLSSQ
jgi:hypothetical protein